MLSGIGPSINIYIQKPHVVNRRIGGAVLLCCYNKYSPLDSGASEQIDQGICTMFQSAWPKECTSCVGPVGTTPNCAGPISASLLNLCLSHLTLSDLDRQKVDAIHIPHDSCTSLVAVLPSAELVSIFTRTVTQDSLVMLRRTVAKQSKFTSPHELIISDPIRNSYSFIPIELSPSDGFVHPVGVSYTFFLDGDGRVQIDTRKHEQMRCMTTSEQWLRTTLLPKIRQWAEPTDDLLQQGGKNSLRLVHLEKYFAKYISMKDKYGQEICKVWPECTDPVKFVYEDVAIAAYLICLWEEEAERRQLLRKQTFVDLGCGNGLLVYILSCEGFSGYGVDTRRRKIWSMLGPSADLRELSIVPSDAHLFPEADWLIGNHSDELTPWIPLMAARSSQQCRFFLLPCCPFDFSGKFQRLSSARSVYSEYLEYVCEVSWTCGFYVERDALRIPSTKRECIIGYPRDVPVKDREEAIAQLLSDSSPCPSPVPCEAANTDDIARCVPPEARLWCDSFVARPAVERVRNCVTVDRSVQARIVNTVAQKLIGMSDHCKVKEHDGSTWHTGGSLYLSEVVELINTGDLQELKSECGGLKTLLKNHRHVFTVLPGAVVQLSDYTDTKLPRKKKNPSKLTAADTRKTRLCWFHEHHPDGCVLSTDNCRYAHGEADLRPRTEPTTTSGPLLASHDTMRV